MLDVNVDPVVGHRRSLDRSPVHPVTSRARARAERARRALRSEATRPLNPAPRGAGREASSSSSARSRHPAGLRARRRRARPGRRRRGRAPRRVFCGELAEARPDTGRGDERRLGRVEVAGAEQRDIAGLRRRRRRSASAAPCPTRSRKASSPACSDRRGRRSRRRRRGRAAARAREPRRRGSSSSLRARAAGRAARRAVAAICAASVSSAITAASGHGTSSRAASTIASPPEPHAPGDAQQPRGELAAAGMALVLGPDRHRRQRPAVGTPRPQRAHRERPLEDDRRETDLHAGALVEALRARVALGIDAEADTSPAAPPETPEGVGQQRRAETTAAPLPCGEEPRHPAHAEPLGQANGAGDDLLARPHDHAQLRVELVVLEELVRKRLERLRFDGSSGRRTRRRGRRGTPRPPSASKVDAETPAGQRAGCGASVRSMRICQKRLISS